MTRREKNLAMTRTKSFAMTGRKRSPYDEKWKTSERGEREGLAMRGREGSWDEGKERAFPQRRHCERSEAISRVGLSMGR
jgi:hypothetical protein